MKKAKNARKEKRYKEVAFLPLFTRKNENHRI